jgi:hypothetical protein
MTHTPGPWYAKDNYVESGEYRIHAWHIVCEADTNETAKFISAAPDMAIALEECIALLEEFAYLSGHKAHWLEEYPELTTARAAISKAKGI